MGQRSIEEEKYCAYPEEPRSSRTYAYLGKGGSGSNLHSDGRLDCAFPLPNTQNTDTGNKVATHLECSALCSAFSGPGERSVDNLGNPTVIPEWTGYDVDCAVYSFRLSFNDEDGDCFLYKESDVFPECGFDASDYYQRQPWLLPDGTPCPLHWTSYHHTSTGCEAYCAAAFQREGSDGTCLPGKPECANWLDDQSFPHEYVTVNAWCICGAKLESEVSPGRYVNRGTIIESFQTSSSASSDVSSASSDVSSASSDVSSSSTAESSTYRRHLNLGETNGAATTHWEWPDPLKSTVSAHHGDHFDVDNTCFAEITSFLTNHIPSTAACAGYMSMSTPPDDLVNNGYDPAAPNGHTYCTNTGTDAGECCVAHRGSDEMSRVWLQSNSMLTNSVSNAFDAPTVVGTAVHTSQVAAIGQFVRRFANRIPQIPSFLVGSS